MAQICYACVLGKGHIGRTGKRTRFPLAHRGETAHGQLRAPLSLPGYYARNRGREDFLSNPCLTSVTICPIILNSWWMQLTAVHQMNYHAYMRRDPPMACSKNFWPSAFSLLPSHRNLQLPAGRTALSPKYLVWTQPCNTVCGLRSVKNSYWE